MKKLALFFTVEIAVNKYRETITLQSHLSKA